MTVRRLSRAWIPHIACVAVLGLLSAAGCRQGRDLTNAKLDGGTGQDAGQDAACAPGFGHCTTRATDVCETNLADSQNCGGCGIKCSTAAPLCTMGASGPACGTSCTGTAKDVCGSSCVNLQTDPKNCGTCGHDCGALANVAPGASGITCQAGVCNVPASACLPGFAHCSPRPDEGCEANLAASPNCGACGVTCSAASPYCSGISGTGKCVSTCTGAAADACSTMCVDLKSDPKNCGTCGHDCTSLPNVKPGATVSCQAGVCAVPTAACLGGYAHCSSRPDDGCETDLTQPKNCGQCGRACGAPTALCSTTSGAPSCASSCAAPAPNLCSTKCVDFQSDPLNCGSCGHDCTSLANVKTGASGIECRSGACYVPPSACVTGFAHCSINADDGCEASLTTTANCGKCGTACVAPMGLCSTTTGAPACSSSCAAPSPDLCGSRCVDFQSDPANCGSCGHDCGALPNVKSGATTQCLAGVCSIPPTSCVSGFAHCAGSPDLGCESSFTSPNTCGSCTTKCSSPKGLCSTTSGAPMCSSSCVAPAPDLCSSQCVDLQSDPLNCGSCGFNCGALPNVKPGATVSCVSGVCSIPAASCASGFAHCTGTGNAGCETNLSLPATCGSCTHACADPMGLCSTTTGVPTCASSCVAPAPDLCTTKCVDLKSDPLNCGSCGFKCSALPNVNPSATVSCVSGVCSIPSTSCQSGFAHCSGSGNLGCETNLGLPATCGSCTNKCGAPTANCAPSPSTGLPVCSSSCVSPTPDLCSSTSTCVSLASDALNCGSCGHNCTTLQNVRTAQGVTCASSACSIPASSCVSGFAHCAGSPDLGCETSTKTNTNCGGCNIPCTSAMNATGSCTTGACLQTCNPGFADCSSTTAGCETPITTAANCGGCGIKCNAASCTTTNGVVTFVPAGTCSTVTSTCTAGVATTCGGFACASTTACGNTCSGTTGCAAGFFCAGTGASATCMPKLTTGLSCSTGTQCTSGFCVDNVCCSTSCPLSATGCMSCALATNQVADGTCAQRVSSTMMACTAANPPVCADLKTDPLNCNMCGRQCSVAVPPGTKAACIAGTCGFSCTTAKSQFCTYQATQVCQSTSWGFEPGANEVGWVPDENTNDSVVTINGNGQPPSAGSLQVFPSSVPSTPAFISVPPCTDLGTFEIGQFSPAGRVFSASILVPSLAGSVYTGTSCQIGFSDLAFNQTVLAQVAPIVPGKYFTLTGTFPSTAGSIAHIFIQCTMPPTWSANNAAQRWYVDDVSIN